MADNAIIKIMTALLKHQVAKVVGDETLEVIGEEIAAIGSDKVDEHLSTWLGDKKNASKIAQAAQHAHDCFREKIEDDELSQWMVSLPIGDLPKVTEAIEKLPTSPDEKQLENSLREAIADWKNLSPEQIEYAVTSFLFCLRSALLPIEKQTLTVIGRSVLRTEEKVDDVKCTVQRSEEKIDLLIRIAEKRFITDEPVTAESLKVEPAKSWNLKHPYLMPANFTGRVHERKMLTDWLQKDSEHRLFILCALGGFGKSALAWHWLTHDVNAKNWPKVIWWSFYEGDASFENFIKETLEYLSVEVPPGQRGQVDALLKFISSQKILLIMDGFERALRAYSSMTAAYQSDEELDEDEINQRDCVNINAEIFLKNLCVLPNIQGKILMTTRLTPRAVEQRGELLGGCHEEELQVMQKEDAVAFFRAQGIRGGRAEIEATCGPYGYHPLSLRILAGLIANDREAPGDISVAKKLDILDDLIANRNHILMVAYNTLTPEQQKLLSHIACFRSAMTYDALKAISTSRGDPSGADETSESIKTGRPHDGFDDDLKTLEHRGLLHWDRDTNKYDLHPIVRSYAYERLTAPDRTATHTRLIDYFDAVPKPSRVEKLEDLAPVIELYHHMIRAGKLSKALQLYEERISMPLYFQFAAYHELIEISEEYVRVCSAGEIPLLPFQYHFVTNMIVNAYHMVGKPMLALKHFAILSENSEEIEMKIALNHLGTIGSYIYLSIGRFQVAETLLRKEINIHQTANGFEWMEAEAHGQLGLLLCFIGKWEESSTELNISIEILLRRRNHAATLGMAYSVLRILLMTRDYNETKNNKKFAIEFAQRTLELALGGDVLNLSGAIIPRNLVLAHWVLGAAYRLDGQLDLADQNLNEAHTRCRAINSVEYEAAILLEIAKLRFAQEKPEEAKALAEEALLITERSGYVLQGADVHLFLATLALEGIKLNVESELSDKEAARQHAEKALELATCDGPPYYYKVAYEEAESMLEKLK